MLREKLFPLLKNIYGNEFENNIHKLAKKSNELNEFFNKRFINPIINLIQKKKYGCYFDISYFKDYNEFIFWESLLTRIFHDILGTSMPKHESINKLINQINVNDMFGFEIHKNVVVSLYKNNLVFINKIIFEKYNEITPTVKTFESDISENILNSFLDGKLSYVVDESFITHSINKSHTLRKNYEIFLSPVLAKNLVLPTSGEIHNKIVISFDI